MKQLNADGSMKGGSYLTTGLWSQQCINQAKRMFSPNEMATGAESGFTDLAYPAQWKIDPKTTFVHFTQNETVHGFQFHGDRDSDFPFHMFKDKTIVCDMSSDIGSRKIDWTKFGVVYAGA